MIPPIEKTVTVPLKPAEAFRVFTQDLAAWWPSETHSLSAASGAKPDRIRVDGRQGGKIEETLPDGSTSDWATITAWQPGERFAFDWYVGRDPSEATQVSVTFLPDADGTRVVLVHDGFDRLGTQGRQLASNYNSGWDNVLGRCYCGACARAAA